MAGAAVVAAGATSRVTECGADRHRERQACKHARDYLAARELHALSPFPAADFDVPCQSRASHAESAAPIKLLYRLKSRIAFGVLTA